MNLKLPHLQSVKTRVSVFTLCIFLLGIWSLAFYIKEIVYTNIRERSGEQQFSTVSLIASGINVELEERLRALTAVAGELNATVLNDTVALQGLIESRFGLNIQFNGGVFVVGTDAKAIASIPLSAERLGASYIDRDYIITSLKEGKAMVGKPIMGEKLQAPVIVMSVPVLDAKGKVLGALAGVTNLGQPNFLSQITDNLYGKTGGYLLVSAQHRLIVTGTDKTRIMEKLPAEGKSPLIDRFISGFEGSGVLVNPLGVEVLASAKGVPLAGWYVAGLIPTAEAFAAVRELQQHLLLATTFLSLLAAGLTWAMLKIQLEPLVAAARALEKQSTSDMPPQALVVSRNDEIGQLIGGFNHLLGRLLEKEEAMHHSEQRYRSLVDWAIETIVIHREGEIVFVNPAAVRMFGAVDARDLVGMPILDLVHPDFHHTALLRARNIAESHVGVPKLEYRLMKLDGSVIDAEVQTTSIVYDHVASFYTSILDITDRKCAETALRISEERFAFALDSSGDGVWDWNVQQGGVQFSRRWKEMLGHTEDEIGTELSEWSSRVHPDDISLVMAEVQAHLDGKTRIYSNDHRMLCKDGSYLWILDRGMVVQRDADGKPVRMVGTHTDISQRKQMEKIKSEFVSTVSHELRTPVTSIRGSLGLLEAGVLGVLPPKALEMVKVANRNSQRLITLVNDILDMDKLLSGKMQLHIISLDIVALIAQAIEANAAYAAGYKVSYALVDAPAHYLVNGDGNRLTQVITNLLSNAAKFSFADTQVQIRIATTGSFVKVEVEDYGAGIPLEFQKRIFEAFAQADSANTRQQGGTGLGLNISKKLIEQMQGEMGFSSVVDQGSIFWFTVPLASDSGAFGTDASSSAA
jgi:PAS domain S-box-containing protein